MRRPFDIAYSAHQRPETIEVRIRFRAPIEARENGAQIVEGVKDRFVDLANCGALCGDGIDPERSGIGEVRAAIEESAATWTFDQVRIDPCSVSILVNMIHAMHDRYMPIAEVRVSWERIAQLRDPSAVEFPQQHPDVPFPVLYDDALSSFDAVIDFAVPQPIEKAEAIEETVGAWISGVNLGAYGDASSSPSINQIYFTPEVSTVAEDAIVWHIERFASGAQAIDGLVNVVSKVHRTEVPVAQLAIVE